MTTAVHTPASITPPPLTGAQALATIAEPYKLPEVIKNRVIEVLVPFVAEAGAVAHEAESVKVTDATQVTEIKKSRELRLKLRKIRTGMEAERKKLKEEFLRPGQYIDAAGRHIVGLIDPVETRLEEQEKFAERKELERKAALKKHREDLLRPYGTDTSAFLLAEMSPDAFAELLEGQKTAHEARIAKAKKDEEDRIAAENARREEEARIRAENERLRKEADEREAAAKAERERQQREQAERDEQARRAREEMDRKLAEATAAREKAEREQQESERRALVEREARERAEREAEEARQLAAQQTNTVVNGECAGSTTGKSGSVGSTGASKHPASERECAPGRTAPTTDRDFSTIKTRLGWFADSIEALPPPSIHEANVQPLLREIADRRGAFVRWMREQIESL